MKKLLLIFLCGAVALLVACPQRPGVAKARSMPSGKSTVEAGAAWAFAAKALEQSPSYSQLKRRSKNADFVIDEDTPDTVIVAIGENMGSHFTRWNTLKIHKKTGAIFRLETDEKLEDNWLVEFQSGK